MATIEDLKAKVEKAGEKVEKCKGTIARHEKQLEKKIQKVLKEVGVDLTGKSEAEIDELREPYRNTDQSWLFFEVTGKMNDIVGAGKKLRDAEIILGNWQEKLDIKINEQKFIEENAPQVIKDFLEEWKRMSHDWHIRRYNDYQDYKKKLSKQSDEAIIEYVESNPEDFDRYLEDGKLKDYWRNDLHNIRSRSLEKHLEEKRLDYFSIKKRRADFAGGVVQYMDTIYDAEERLAWLEKTLEQEKQAKLLDLILRISKVVGEIQDATYLKINQKGNLDGTVVGDKGKAHVETIGAGGYAVQCFHYRTLVKPIK